jgi:hypothetical protein
MQLRHPHERACGLEQPLTCHRRRLLMVDPHDRLELRQLQHRVLRQQIGARHHHPVEL